MPVDTPLLLLADLQRAALSDTAVTWSDLVDKCAAVLGGAGIWWLRRAGDDWRCVARTLERDPPANAVRCERDDWALCIERHRPDPLDELVFGILLLRARRDEWERAQREAQEARAALRDLGFEGLVVSRDGVIVEVNQALAELYGYAREEMIGLHMSQLIAPEVLPQVVELVKRGYQQPYETAALRKDGTIIPLEARGKEVVYEGQRARVASFRDLRDAKAASAALEAARRAAELASEKKTVFLGNISHELRTPMNGVLGITQLLSREPLDENARLLVEQLHVSVTHVVDLLDDLLDLTRIEAGRFELRDRPLQVRVLLDALLRSLRSVHPRVTLGFSIDPTAEGWWRGDDRRIRQILLNLLDNAVKYTEVGRIDVSVARDEGMLSFSVRDTGIGIASDELPALFQRFERGRADHNDAYRGAGLGLHISHELAERMGGRLTVESVEGVGSTFRLSLPLLPLRDAPSHTTTVSPPREASLRVLVAEDDRVSQLVMRRLLESLRHTVVVVSTGADAMAAVEESPFDVVLMDLQMPVLGGLDATRALRARGCEIPIVALTAHAMKADLEACLDVGMNAWITKPVELPRLEAVLAEVTGTLDTLKCSA